MPPMRNDPFQRLGLDREVLTVSQLNQRARLLLEDVFPQVWVEGELSNLARPASGHVYFTLKDSNAQIRCALFRQNALRVRQALRDGLAVKVRGKISLFEGRGDYQLIADTVEPAGDGALRLAFEALKEKLAGEGLFASERKRPLPAHPRRIGIVSSPSGAVIRDIISVFRRRAPQVELTLVPTAVQGREAVAQIVRALQLADRQGFDALILARGGGSLEDLWCFNEEAVARAVAACATPIVSAVGHETDVSISDFVADVRARRLRPPPNCWRPTPATCSSVSTACAGAWCCACATSCCANACAWKASPAACAIPANACASRRSAWTTRTCACAVPSSASWRSTTNAWSAWRHVSPHSIRAAPWRCSGRSSTASPRACRAPPVRY